MMSAGNGGHQPHQGFQPRPDVLQEVVSLLEVGFHPTPENQHFVQRELDKHSQSPLFQQYLAYFLSHHDEAIHILQQHQSISQAIAQQAQALGQMAGLLLKTVMDRYGEKTDDQTMEQVKHFVLVALETATVPSHRRVAAVVAATIVRRTSLKRWQHLLERIYQSVKGVEEGTSNANVCKGYLYLFQQLCEDVREELVDKVEQLGRPLSLFLPTMLNVVSSIKDTEMQRMILSSIYQLIEEMPPALSSNLTKYFQTLFLLASSEDEVIRKVVSESLVLLALSEHSDIVLNHFDAVVKLILNAMEDSDPAVAMAATEFWSVFVYSGGDASESMITPYLEQVLPTLLRNMRYSKEELMDAAVDNTSDAHIPDRVQDVKPWVRKDKKKKTPTDEEDEEPEGSTESYTLRRVSAHTLDTLALYCGNAISTPLLRHLPSYLESQGNDHEEWMKRDIGVLALGAVAEGCYDDLEEHLPKLIPYLVKLTEDCIPAVRAVATWCLSRFGQFICSCEDHTYGLTAVFPSVLKRALDGVKHVQWYSMSAVVDFIRHMEDKIEVFVDSITECFTRAAQIYQLKSRMLLFDAVAELAENSPAVLFYPQFHSNVLKPLVNRYIDLAPDQELELLPLMEVIASIAMNTSDKFLDFANPVYQKTKSLLEDQVTTTVSRKDKGEEPPDLDLLNTSIDLVAGIAEGIGPSFESLLTENDCPRFLQLLLYCLEEGPDTRQSVYALFGDISQNAFPCINNDETLNVILGKLMKSLNSDNFFEINNCIWATGEIICRADSSFAYKYGPTIVEQLLPWFSDLSSANRLLLENLGIIIGRLAMVAPDVVGKYLPQIVTPWCQSLSLITDEQEKYSAFQGLVKLMEHQPQPFLQSFHAVLFTIASWFSTMGQQEDPQGLQSSFGNLIRQFRQHCGDRWPNIVSQCQPEVRQILSQCFPDIF